MPLIIIFVSFVIGTVLGCFFPGEAEGLASLTGESDIFCETGYFKCLLSCSAFHLLIVLFATSFLGVAFIPLTVAVRGFFMSCAVSGLIVSGDGGFLLALVSIGLPAILTLPCLFILGRDGLMLSRLLLGRFWGRARRPVEADAGNLALCCAVLALAAGIKCIIVPQLVRLIL